MAIFYEVDPAAPNDQARHIKHLKGAVKVVLRTGRPVERVNGAIPEDHLYDAVEATGSCPHPDYYDPRTTTAFSGALGTATGLVTETLVCDQVDIDLLLLMRLSELSKLSGEVLAQGTDVTLPSDGLVYGMQTDTANAIYYDAAGDEGALPGVTTYATQTVFKQRMQFRKSDVKPSGSAGIKTYLALHYGATLGNERTASSTA